MGLHDCSLATSVQSHLKTITTAIMRALNGDNSEGKEHTVVASFFFPPKNVDIFTSGFSFVDGLILPFWGSKMARNPAFF